MPVSTATAPRATSAPADGAATRALDRPMTWDDVCARPELRDLPYRIELDRYGRLLMSPVPNRHSRIQGRLARILEDALGGEAYPEGAIETSEGVRSPDVVWMSDGFATSIPESTFALPMAPEICVEVMSPSNVWAEMEEKVTLYLARGAQEVWICEADGALRVFGHEGEIPASRLAPDASKRIEL